MRATFLGVALLSAVLVAQERTAPLQITFTASRDSFDAATKEYREIWATEASRVVTAMQLRASYLPATKRATLVHELGHRLMGDLVPAEVDHHSIIFLFVYDVWVELWGQSFADEQVTIERARTGSLANYDKLWTEALALSAAERALRFKPFVQQHRK